MPNSPVGLQPVSWELIFPFCRCGTTRQGQCFCCSPGEKINAELTGWTPTGELGINFSFLSLWYDQAMTVFLLLPRRKINAELTGWTPTGELGINFSFSSLWYDQAVTVFLLLPRRKINAELTGWTPTGELGINILRGGDDQGAKNVHDPQARSTKKSWN